MDERAALDLLANELGPAGDDAAVVDGHVLTTDMLHASTDFPPGTTRYTAGWRAVGASLSDVAAMGAGAVAAVAVYAAPSFDREELLAFVRGARDVCELVGAEYVGGDLDTADEFTAVSTVLGSVDDPVLRSGATPGEVICVTGTLGKSAAAVRLFERAQARAGAKTEAATEDVDRANELFRFEPRVRVGQALAEEATAMMDSSDGLARSLHQLAEASGCGFAIESGTVPIHAALHEVADSDVEALERAITFGEDFELVFTAPEDALEGLSTATDVPVTQIGTVVEDGVTMDGDRLADRGYTHG